MLDKRWKNGGKNGGKMKGKNDGKKQKKSDGKIRQYHFAILPVGFF
jgi:hypothetical protein